MSSSITFHDITSTISFTVDKYLLILGNYIEQVPGGAILVRYIKSSHQDDPFRTVLELILVIFAIRYFTTSRYEVKKKGFVKLSEKEVDDLIDDWEPEPLVLPLVEEEKWKLKSVPVIKGPIAEKVMVDDDLKINLASLNFLNFGVNALTKTEASKIIQQNGVGACGPPNFYGNQDIHVKLEDDLKRFFGTEGAVLYGQDFTTAGSVLPSFLKRGDTVIADCQVNVAIQKAISLSRANIYWYAHNDLQDLETILEDLQENAFKNEKPISRKFIITEGLFANTGDFPDLVKLIELKKRFKFRLFLDESLSLGVLGKTGRGLTEHFGVDRKDIDITISSMANAFCSSGAFCIGDRVMSYHQRIGSLAYCFSASLPAYVARATSTALKLIEESVDEKTGQSSILKKLQTKNELLYEFFKNDKELSNYVEITSTKESSIVHLRLNEKLRERLNLPTAYTGKGSEIFERNKKGKSDKFVKSLNDEEKLIQKIINDAMEEGVLITRSTYSYQQELFPVYPHLKITTNVDLTDAELSKSCKVIKKAIVSNLKDLTIEDLENIVL